MKGGRKKSLEGFWNKGAASITQSVIYQTATQFWTACLRQNDGHVVGGGGLIITIKLFQSEWSSNQSLRFQRPILRAKIDIYLKLLRDTFGVNASSSSCRDQTRGLTLGPYYSGGGGGGGLGSVSCVDFQDNSLVAWLHHHDDQRLSWWSEKLQRFCSERAWSESGSGSEETSLLC